MSIHNVLMISTLLLMCGMFVVMAELDEPSSGMETASRMSDITYRYYTNLVRTYCQDTECVNKVMRSRSLQYREMRAYYGAYYTYQKIIRTASANFTQFWKAGLTLICSDIAITILAIALSILLDEDPVIRQLVRA